MSAEDAAGSVNYYYDADNNNNNGSGVKKTPGSIPPEGKIVRGNRPISGLDIPDAAKTFLASKGFVELYPPQAAAVDAGLFDGGSLLVSAPTASGKTLVAMLAIISHMSRRRGRIVYLSPLRALAAEKHAEFTELCDVVMSGGVHDDNDNDNDGSTDAHTTKKKPALRPLKIARATGEMRGSAYASTSAARVGDADLIVATNESMDAAMRRNHAWTEEVGLVIADEIHLIGDSTRGPTLEMILTRLKMRGKKSGGGSNDDDDDDGNNNDNNDDHLPLQIVGLSATVSNDYEMARWLGCMLVKSQWRPVPLAEGVCDAQGHVLMGDGQTFDVGVGTEGMAARLGVHAVSESGDSANNGVNDAGIGTKKIKRGGQSLVFAATRTSSRATAIRASKLVDATLAPEDKEKLAKVASKIMPGFDPSILDARGKKKSTAQEKTTAQANNNDNDNAHTSSQPPQPQQQATDLQKDLAAAIYCGVAFHHAGLSEKMRQTIEDEFRRGTIRLIASTPTLAAGVNLPARRVVISSVSRYDARYGYNAPISVMEYKQLCGRAGRPQYDQYGEAITCTGSGGDTYEIMEQYVRGEPEPLESRIMDEKAMRTHLLTVVVLNPGTRRQDITNFFLQTLAGFQSPDELVYGATQTAIDFLLENNMIVSKGDRYAATTLGKKTSSLYVDPVTAAYLRNTAAGAPKVNLTADPRTASSRRHTLGFLHAITCCDEFLPRQSLLKNQYGIAESLLSGSRGAELLSPVYAEECSRSLLVLDEWVSERTEKEIEAMLKTQSGDLHRMTESASWLARVLYEMARHAGRTDLLDEIAILQTRIKSGIKEELTDLASIRGVGRVRARALYRAGITDVMGLRAASLARLATIRQIGPTVASSIKRAADASRATGRGAGRARR